MKKVMTGLFLAGAGLVLLAACSNQQAAESESSTASSALSSSQQEAASASSAAASSQSQGKTSDKESEKKEEMDIAAIAQGDYSSIKGSWKNAAGQVLVFDDQGLVSAEYELYGASLTDYGTAAAGVYGGESGGFLLEFVPKGVSLAERENFQDSSDSSRDRLWTGVGMNSFDEQGSFYYRD